MNTARSASLFEAARELMPGGVSSPVRAFRGVGGVPRFMERGEGAFVFDTDGNRYTDYVLSWGPLIAGHANPRVTSALEAQIRRGTSFGAPTEIESELARRIIRLMPAIEMVRFVSSGTEATMSAIRLARAFTGREKVVKFAGCYHGHADPFLVQAGSGVATLGLPDSPGVSASVTSNTLTAQFNDANAVEELCRRREVAAVIVEPVAGNMGLVLPAPGYLQSLREITARYGTLLLFDEVMTGFRVALGGAQQLYNIVPDLTCLGKVIGGGLPAAAYGGRRDIMQRVAPAGDVYQAGTLSGNPLAMTAGLATLQEIEREGVFESLTSMARSLGGAAETAARAAGVPLTASAVGSMWGFFLSQERVTNYETAKRAANGVLYARLFHALLARGVYLAPSAFEAAFVSTAHDAHSFRATEQAFSEAFYEIATEYHA